MFDNKKKIGLVLGGGATKGLIHIGVLRYLEEHNYTITEIAGTSVGALLGSLIAMGKTADEIYTIINNTNTMDLVDFDRKDASIGGEKIIAQLEEIIGDVLIEDLPIPFTAIATDLNTGEEVVFTSGPVIDAVRYSISVPGIFSLHDDNKPIVDGGIINNLPINHIKNKNIIAVSCRGYGTYKLPTSKKIRGRPLPNNPLSKKTNILMRSLLIMMRQIEDLHLQNHPKAKLIRPYTGDISSYDIGVLETAVNRGYDEAAAVLGK